MFLVISDISENDVHVCRIQIRQRGSLSWIIHFLIQVTTSISFPVRLALIKTPKTFFLLLTKIIIINAIFKNQSNWVCHNADPL